MSDPRPQIHYMNQHTHSQYVSNGYDGRSMSYRNGQDPSASMADHNFDPWMRRGLTSPNNFELYPDERYRYNLEQDNYPHESYGAGGSGFHVSGTAPWTTEWRT